MALSLQGIFAIHITYKRLNRTIVGVSGPLPPIHLHVELQVLTVYILRFLQGVMT